MNLKEARLLEKAWPERYKILAKALRGDDYNIPLFTWKMMIKKDYGDWENLFIKHPTGIGRNVVNGIGEWLFI